MGLYPKLFQTIPSLFRLRGNPRDSFAGRIYHYSATHGHASRQAHQHASRCTGQRQQLHPYPHGRKEMMEATTTATHRTTTTGAA